MNLASQSRRTSLRKRDGSVLVIVLWIAFGLVTVALYFGQSMALELRAAGERVHDALGLLHDLFEHEVLERALHRRARIEGHDRR